MGASGVSTSGRLVAVIMAAVFALSACTTTSSSGTPTSPAQRQLQERNDRFNQTIAEGALFGALAGALLGAAVSDNKAQGAAIGALAGAAVGGGAGYVVASQQSGYASREQLLDAQISQAREQVSAYQQDVKISEQLVAQQRTRVANLRAQVASGQITQQQYQSEMAGVQSAIDDLQYSLDANRDNIEMIERDIADLKSDGYNTAALENERNKYEALQRQQAGLLGQLVDEARG